MFRNPRYLDVNLLLSMADFFGVPLPDSAEITHRTTTQRGGRIGVKYAVDASGERGSSEDRTAVYSQELRPVRALNDVVEKLLHEEHAVDLTFDPKRPVKKRDVVQIEGDMTLSPATEVAAIVSQFLPILMSHPERLDDDLDPEMLQRLVMQNDRPAFAQIYEISSAVPDTAVNVVVDANHVFEGFTLDDLDNELTVLGHVDQLVQPGQHLSLERHLLPGINRTARRALGGEQLNDLLGSFSELGGKELDASVIRPAGPAMLIRPVAIY